MLRRYLSGQKWGGLVMAAMWLSMASFAAEEIVGERPYELVWANRTQDDNPPLVDFEDLTGWTVTTQNMEATFERSREQQIWDKYVGKLTYRATGSPPSLRFGPPEPIAITQPFDAVTCWIYGNNWGYAPNPSTPSVSVAVLFVDSQGREIRIPIAYVNWEEWHLCHWRLSPEQINMVRDGARFVCFEVTGGRNKENRVLYFDNLAVFTEKFPPLTFAPRPARGIPMFPGQTVGTNTGPGKLPFPTRLQTILPDNLTKNFKTSAVKQGNSYVFTYKGDDGTLVYKVTPQTGMWTDITAFWQGRSGTIRPLVEGGAYFVQDNKLVAPEKIEPLGQSFQKGELTCRWRLTSAVGTAEVTYVFRLWNKSLVIDTIAPGGLIGEVRYGHAEGVENPRLVVNPYYLYDQGRPAVVVMGPPDKPLFMMGNTDVYLSNASVPFAINEIKEGRVYFQGGTRYIPKTDGKRNDVYERFFLTISPRYEEVLPTVPNPVSPWKHITGTHVWRAHGASDRKRDAEYWTNIWRYGMRKCVITDHETGWRDGGESFTFRTKAAPKKGGDQGQYEYARLMQDKLGFVYGPYNNFTDFAPVNEYWSFDLISRTPDNQLQRAWFRCYAPKPARAVEYCEKLAPIIQQKFKFSTAYCDVHTCVSPWSRVDYDYRVPGAGTFAATFYAFGEIMLLQKKAWNGPVYSEGGHHFWYSGLTDGNYAQDQAYDIPNNPWLVDLDLRKMHDLCCNFGMGNEGMFYGRDEAPRITPEEKDAYTDRFLAATVAFGHPGFLAQVGGFDKTLRSYYMLQQLHSDYTQVPVRSIRYLDAQGKLLDTSAAVATGAYTRSQIVTEYANGTITVVNGNKTERMKVLGLDLPPNGYAGWTKDKSIYVFSGDSGPGTPRYDYCVSPAYIYIDGRGRFTRCEKAASDKIGICRILGQGQYEIIPYQGADCGFAIQATKAVALNKEGQEIGPAQLRVSRGLTYVIPVEGAFSYLLSGPAAPSTRAASGASAPGLQCPRDEVVPGEIVTVRGQQEHQVRIPPEAQPGQRIWEQLEGQWIDFTVVPLTEMKVWLEEDNLHISLRSRLAQKREATVKVGEQQKTIVLAPQEKQLVSFPLGAPQEEELRPLVIEVQAGELRQRHERSLRIIRGYKRLVELPDKFTTGMALRGQKETNDFGETRGFVALRSTTCGDVTKPGVFMHPPYVGGVGYAFLLYEPVQLPPQPAAFRAVVGKGDGSDLGDGILYKVAVVDASGKETVIGEQTVQEHKWLPIEGDLSPWAGQKVQIKLISDVGVGDNSTGDWACWAEMRIESVQPVLTRLLEESSEYTKREPGPYPARGLSVEDLRRALRGRLVYDGCGLSGTGEYATYAILNGVRLGTMAPAGGNEVQGIWAEKVSVPLTPEAIRTLGRRNVFILDNPNRDYFKVRRFWLELELPEGRKVSSDIAAGVFTQPPHWQYAEGLGVPFEKNIEIELWFDF